jgi:hypothetical protein
VYSVHYLLPQGRQATWLRTSPAENAVLFDDAAGPRPHSFAQCERGLRERTTVGSRLTDAGQQPPHYLPVRIAAGRDSLHRLLSEGPSLLFGLSLVLRKRHPFADDFSARLVFRLHVKTPLVPTVVDGGDVLPTRWRGVSKCPTCAGHQGALDIRGAVEVGSGGPQDHGPSAHASQFQAGAGAATAARSPAGIEGALEYASDLFDRSSVEAIAGRLRLSSCCGLLLHPGCQCHGCGCC